MHLLLSRSASTTVKRTIETRLACRSRAPMQYCASPTRRTAAQHLTCPNRTRKSKATAIAACSSIDKTGKPANPRTLYAAAVKTSNPSCNPLTATKQPGKKSHFVARHGSRISRTRTQVPPDVRIGKRIEMPRFVQRCARHHHNQRRHLNRRRTEQSPPTITWCNAGRGF